MMKNKVWLIVILTIIVLAVAGYLVWNLLLQKTPEEKAAESLDKTLGSAAAGVLPEINPLSNPVGNNLPETNPIDKTNPFKNIYTNPF